MPAPTALVDPATFGQPWGDTVQGLLTFRGNPTRSYLGTGPVPRTRPALQWKYPRDLRMCGTSTENNTERTFCGIGWTFVKLRKAEWLRDRKINVLFQMALGKHPDIPEVPQVQELARTPADRQILDLLMAPQDMGRPFFAPPEIPAGRLTILRDAFAKTLKDPDFLREADRAGVEVQYTSGEAVHDVLRKAYASPPELVKRTTELLR